MVKWSRGESMYKTESELSNILDQLLKNPENEYIEFYGDAA